MEDDRGQIREKYKCNFCVELRNFLPRDAMIQSL